MKEYSIISLEPDKPHCNIPYKIQKDIQVFVDGYNYEQYFKRDKRTYTPEQKLDKIEKYKSDNFIAKCSEFAVCEYLKARYKLPEDVKPDLELYENNQKNWNPDLYYSEKHPELPNFHVKSCRLYSPFPMSWTCQFSNANGKGGRDTILNDINNPDYIVFTTVQNETISTKDNHVYIKACIPVSFVLKNDILSRPVLDNLASTKKLVYYSPINIKGQSCKGLVDFADVI